MCRICWVSDVNHLITTFNTLNKLSSGFAIRKFTDLLGFDKDIVTATSYGTRLPDITRSLDNSFIHTNVVSDSVVSGVSSDILYRFSVDNLPLSFPFHIEPKRALYNKIN